MPKLSDIRPSISSMSYEEQKELHLAIRRRRFIYRGNTSTIVKKEKQTKKLLRKKSPDMIEMMKAELRKMGVDPDKADRSKNAS